MSATPYANLGKFLASTLCSFRLSKFMGPTKGIWNAAVQKRVGVTSSALGNMKGLKLMGMTDIVSSDIQNLRVKELDLSKKFRKLIVWMNCICTFPISANSARTREYLLTCF